MTADLIKRDGRDEARPCPCCQSRWKAMKPPDRPQTVMGPSTPVGGDRHHVLVVQLRYHPLHQRRHRAVSGPDLDVVELAVDVHRRTADDRRNVAEALEVGAVADRAGTVLPPPPVVTISSPFLMLPGGTWATKPTRGSRLSATSSFCGSSMMRLPIGSVPTVFHREAHGAFADIGFRHRVALDHLVPFRIFYRCENIRPPVLISSSVRSLAKPIITAARMPLRVPALNSAIWRMM